MTCQAYAHAVPCSQCQIPTETLFAYEPYCCLECEAEPSMTELHREHPGYAKASPCCSEMARAEERASILFDLKGGFNETPYAVDHNARRVQPCEESSGGLAESNAAAKRQKLARAIAHNWALATAHSSGALSMKTALASSVGNSRSSKLRFALRPHHVLNCMALPGQAQKHVLFSIRNLKI